MHHHYPRTTVVLTAALGLLAGPLWARPNVARPMTPTGCTLPTNRDAHGSAPRNFVADQATKRLYAVYRLIQKPHEGKLVQFDLN